ncbi:MAG: hydantoinase/oxoprolinase family protein, partial [Actinobacteria bacterium]
MRTAHVQIGVDIGGTFTDIVALDGQGRLVLTKVPTTPKDLLEGVAVAVRRVLAQAGAPASTVERFIHG